MMTNRSGFILLATSLILAFAYLMVGYGLPIGYPGTVALKASGILLLAVYAARQKGWLLMLALIFSAIGDVMLALEPGQLVSGMASFGLAHVVYGYLFARIWRQHGQRPAGLLGAALVAIYGALMLYWLLPGMAALAIPASGYLIIIMFMAALAFISRVNTLALSGAILFVLSDSLIAIDLFRDIDPAWRGPAVWITYVAAQLCLTLGLVKQRP